MIKNNVTCRLHSKTIRAISHVFDHLDYATLGPIYCDEGGDKFWKAKRGLCQKLGTKLAAVLHGRLKPGGRSLYVGAGVAEIPALMMESMELGRGVVASNLREEEVRVLNRACGELPFRFLAKDAGAEKGPFDHLWMVSVLNDPERFPDLAALSYGRACPLTFNPAKFVSERRKVRALRDRCLRKLSLPALVTTSTEELQWIAEWCHRWQVPYVVEKREYPSATVGDPISFVRVGRPERNEE